MNDSVVTATKTAMEKALQALESDLQKLRTGRAHPSLLDHLYVDYYGTPTPIKQVANIAVEDARTLSLTPWEPTMVAVIEKAIRVSDLGLNPTTAGQVIRIPLPSLTEERRKDFIKLVKEEGERSKISIRNARRDAIQSFKEQEKAKQLTEDDVRRYSQLIQKTTDEMIAKAAVIIEKKEADLLQV